MKTKIQFAFTIKVDQDKAQRFTASVLPRVAQFVVALGKDFPSLEGNV